MLAAADLLRALRLTIALTVPLLAATACVGERSEPGEDPDTTSTPDLGDADLLDLTSAPDSQTDPDVPAPDVTVDATGADVPAPDATAPDTTEPDIIEPGLLNVSFERVTGRLDGITVIAHRADGSVHEQTATDANGTAAITVEPGGILTIDGSSVFGERMLLSVYDVQPGDDIVFTNYETSGGMQLGTQTVTVDSANYPSVRNFVVSNGCDARHVAGGAIERVELSVSTQCVSENQTTDLLLWGYDINDRVILTRSMFDVPISAPQTVSGFSSQFASTDIEVSNVLDDTRNLWMDATIEVDGVRHWVPPEAVALPSAPDANGRATGTVAHPTNTPNVLDYRLVLSSQGGAFSRLEVDSTLPIERITVNAAADLLPFIDSISVDITGNTPIMSWAARGSLDRADAMLGMLSWESPNGQRGWAVIMPPSADGTVVFPQLPATMSDHAPPRSGSVYSMFMASAASFVSGYDDARQAPIAPFAERPFVDTEYSVARTGYSLGR